jgi:hypothetical protein
MFKPRSRWQGTLQYRCVKIERSGAEVQLSAPAVYSRCPGYSGGLPWSSGVPYHSTISSLPLIPVEFLWGKPKTYRILERSQRKSGTISCQLVRLYYSVYMSVGFGRTRFWWHCPFYEQTIYSLIVFSLIFEDLNSNMHQKIGTKHRFSWHITPRVIQITNIRHSRMGLLDMST